MNRAAVLAIAALLAGCDWANATFLNSIPLDGERTDDMYVYLAYDGLAPTTVKEAMARGAFAGGDWKSSKWITDFPGSSDTSWSRILRAERMKGYEYAYYDPKHDQLVNAGIPGLLKHILPVFTEVLNFEPDYQRAWDYRSHGYSHNFEVYSDTWVSLGESLDDLFFQLDGHAQTSDVFIGYFMEGDVLGHTGVPEDCTRLLLRLESRIEEFKQAHPKRKFHFTIFSDHGFDYTPMPGSHFLDYGAELPKVGITVVDNLAGTQASEGVFAVPILHARLMYLAIHTRKDQVAEVGLRASQLPSVDFSVGRLGPSRYAIWSDGQLSGTFDYTNGAYGLNGDFSRFGVPAGVSSISDEALFDLTRDGEYPDLFYRTRTALSDLAAEYPCDVLTSNKSGWQSRGWIPPPDADAMLKSGAHGGAHAKGIGAILTEERDLPTAVRADAFLDLFPRAAQHLRDRGLKLRPTDPDADRPSR